jgi:hypothetical protein
MPSAVAIAVAVIVGLWLPQALLLHAEYIAAPADTKDDLHVRVRVWDRSAQLGAAVGLSLAVFGYWRRGTGAEIILGVLLVAGCACVIAARTKAGWARHVQESDFYLSFMGISIPLAIIAGALR